MRPKPLMPTRTVTRVSSGGTGGGLGWTALSGPDPTVHARRPDRSGLEHLRGEVGLGAGDAEVGRALVGHGEQAADAAGDGILGQRRVGELAELLEAGLGVVEPEAAGGGEVVRDVVAEDLEGPLDPRAGGDRGPGRA